jgi:DNA-directed RNA polymerase specialized sigma24 family protein
MSGEEPVSDPGAPVGGGGGGSVTRWVKGLKDGDPAAAYQLWQRYFHRLVGLAEEKLRKLSYRSASADHEDVALSAFHSLCTCAAKGRFDRLDDRDDLWRLLVVITSRKASDQKQWEGRAKRGGGRVVSEKELADVVGVRSSSPWDELPSDEPTPEFAAMLAEEYQNRINSLPRDELKRIAVLRMEGYSNEEIAAQLGCAVRTVARRLEMIRATWGDDDPADRERPA